jgi:hypothetical protein
VGNYARIDQTRGGLDALVREFAAWLPRWSDSGKFTTQVDTLAFVLGAAFRGLRNEAGKLDPGHSPGTVYRDCTRIDHGALWARRVWLYYRSKFDQRFGPFGATLAAADEIVWSCYKQPFDTAERQAPEVRRGPAPLAYIDEMFSARAFVRDQPPQGLRVPVEVDSRMRGAMDDFLRLLPIPVLALPAVCVDAPWWLAIAAHEVGHHVQHDLLPGARLERDFENGLAAAAEAAAPGSGPRWRAWGREVFADAFSIAMVGPAARWIIAELEFGDAKRMLTPAVQYPAPAVRLSLMVAIEEVLGATPPGPAGILDAVGVFDGAPLVEQGRDLGLEARRDLACAREIAPTLASGALVGGESLRSLCRWNAAAFRSRVEPMVTALADGSGLYPDSTLASARQLAAATTLAYAAATVNDDAVRRQEEVRAVAERALAAFPHTAEEGTRRAEGDATELERHTDELVSLLLTLPDA